MMPAMIVAPQPVAVEEGAKVLMRGGNAIDAVVTCAFVQGIVDPQMCGIGGYGILHLYQPPQSPVASRQSPRTTILDFPALAGSKVKPEMWQSLLIRESPSGWGFFLKGKVNDAGYKSICTPGTVKGLHAMLQRWGTISWKEALEPAIRIAEEGFTVSANLAAGWKAKAKFPEDVSLLEYIQANPEARRIYLKPDGSPYDAGEILRNPDYARTLRRLAEEGPDVFYTGELAQKMAEDIESNDGFVTYDDFAGYKLRDEQPVVGTYRGYTIATSQPPHGGPTLLQILNILEGYDLAHLEHNSPDYIYLVAMAMKAAFADRVKVLGDPKFVDVPLDWLISKERAAEWRKKIDAGEPIKVDRLLGGLGGSEHTTHVSVVDKDGNCVALTHSLGSSSGVITPGLGFIYNNSMVNFYPLPGHPNSIAPRKGRTTGMTPTIVFKNGKPVLVVGAPGATRIITAVLQVLLNIIDFGMSISEAISAPRFDCQNDWIECQARIPEFVCEQVRKKHPIIRAPQSVGGFALVHGICIDLQTGKLSGGADAGGGGMALSV